MAAPTGRSTSPQESEQREPVGSARGAGWRVVTDEGDGVEAISTALASQHHAVDFARDLFDAGLHVLRIESPEGTIPADAVAALCGKLKRAPHQLPGARPR